MRMRAVKVKTEWIVDMELLIKVVVRVITIMKVMIVMIK
jgi:hypothetical protein